MTPTSIFKGQLAQLYYPDASPTTALRWLNEDISRDSQLVEHLQRVGYSKSTRRLSRPMVVLIRDALGEP